MTQNITTTTDTTEHVGTCISPLIWDAHACFPLNNKAELEDLKRYKNIGVSFVSLNVGMDMDSFDKVMGVIAAFRRYILSHPIDYYLVSTTNEITQACKEKKLAIAFDLEGSDPLNGDLNMVSLYYDLGVRQMLLAYNKDNQAAGGCLEGKYGLTEFGKAVINEMNRVGMIVDLAHMGYKASMESIEISRSPVIFSHANPKAKQAHFRNISDEQIIACAKTGGVIGINGVYNFLGSVTSDHFVDHIEYVANLVGAAHVGIGLDYVVDKNELKRYIKTNPGIFPPDKIKDFMLFVEPEQIPEFAELLAKRGFDQKEIHGIMGENFLRVARQVWR